MGCQVTPQEWHWNGWRFISNKLSSFPWPSKSSPSIWVWPHSTFFMSWTDKKSRVGSDSDSVSISSFLIFKEVWTKHHRAEVIPHQIVSLGGWRGADTLKYSIYEYSKEQKCCLLSIDTWFKSLTPIYQKLLAFENVTFFFKHPVLFSEIAKMCDQEY